jgi:hypothetical protein
MAAADDDDVELLRMLHGTEALARAPQVER